MIQRVVDPDENKDLRDLAAEVVDKPEEWMNHPHPMLGMQRPRDLLGTPQEPILRAILRGIKTGSFS
jgi:uncharacterized protein (DUF2384 family)